MIVNKDDIILANMLEDNSDIISIVTDSNEEIPNEIEISDGLPILPLRNTVLFPKVVIPILIGREKSVKLIKSIYNGNKIIGCVGQIDPHNDNPKFEDIYKFGTVGKIVKIFEMPDGSKSVIIQGLKRFEIKQLVSEKPYFKAKVDFFQDILPAKDDKEFDAIISNLKDLSIKIIELSENIPQEASFAIKNIDNPLFLINFVSSNSDIGIENKQKLLEINDLKQRSLKLLEHLNVEVQKLELKGDIQHKVNKELDKQHREYLLNQQLKTIQDELGGDPVSVETDELLQKAKKVKFTKEAKERFDKEIGKLQRMHPHSPDFSIQLTYLQTLLELPWGKYTKDNFDLPRAEKILDEDHYGLDNVKERILEYLAVLKLKGNLKSPIICLYGPPGVGKTSLGKSVARALKRKYVRMSLGGLHDEAEIRGHRKTYIGAMPGRIIQSMLKAKSANPVFVLDEIDKVGNDFRGDPSSALLEVLDPEQNSNFYDNYLELEFDLSNVMFIATANHLSTIAPALLDRMELINVTGYIIEEKIEIAKRHLIPQQLKDHGIKNNLIRFSDSVLEFIIDNFTRESGVRNMNKVLASVIRKIAKKIAFSKKYNVNVTKEDIIEYLKSPKYTRSKYMGNKIAGLVTGLAWTSVGGEITTVESSISRGTGKLTLTGNLGNVMKESAIIALEYLKAHAKDLQLNPQVFNYWNIHIHVPEGAVPKDGPSAGITMATSLASLFTQRKVKQDIAMTGEITLSGIVLPVGGIKEKILAAKRAGITEIIISEENKNDIEEIKEIYRKDVKFHFVEKINDVLKIALLDEKVENALRIGVPKKKK
jgi:ATP-dependent Lon protease